MDRARAAEWVLRRVAARERATAMVGDQVETQPGVSGFHFWSSIVWLVVVLSWRNVAALLVAPVAAVLLDVALWMKVEAPHEILMLHSGRQVEMLPTLTLYGFLSGLYMLLWGQAIFALVRFGARDVFFRASAVSALAMTAVAALTWSPYLRVVSLAAVGLLVVFHVSGTTRRAAFGVCLAVLSSDFLLGRWLLRVKWPDALIGAQIGPLLFLTSVMGGALAMWLHERVLESPDHAVAE